MLPYEQPEVITFSRHMADSFTHWTGKQLLEGTRSDEALAHDLYHASFVMASHDSNPDPVLNYGNLAAQLLWGFSWKEFTAMPSRLASEPEVVEERKRLIQDAYNNGHVDHYQAVRLSRRGRRFLIRDAYLWNVLDAGGACIGQASTFSKWDWL